MLQFKQQSHSTTMLKNSEQKRGHVQNALLRAETHPTSGAGWGTDVVNTQWL